MISIIEYINDLPPPLRARAVRRGVRGARRVGRALPRGREVRAAGRRAPLPRARHGVLLHQVRQPQITYHYFYHYKKISPNK